MSDASFCRKCGLRRPARGERAVYPRGSVPPGVPMTLEPSSSLVAAAAGRPVSAEAGDPGVSSDPVFSDSGAVGDRRSTGGGSVESMGAVHGVSGRERTSSDSLCDLVGQELREAASATKRHFSPTRAAPSMDGVDDHSPRSMKQQGDPQESTRAGDSVLAIGGLTARSRLEPSIAEPWWLESSPNHTTSSCLGGSEIVQR